MRAPAGRGGGGAGAGAGGDGVVGGPGPPGQRGPCGHATAGGAEGARGPGYQHGGAETRRSSVTGAGTSEHGCRASRVRQHVTAGNNANVAGQDQVIINITAAGTGEPVMPGPVPRDVPGFTGRES
jgi:hypothetical protein